MNSAIIVAAGTGQRFGSDIPKQFTLLCGKPLIIHTLQRFETCPSVDEIILVLSKSGRSEFEALAQTPQFSKLKSIITGGATRAESVLNGLAAVSPDCTVVAVHDGARPLVSVDEITATIEMASETGAACLVAPVTDTIKTIRGDEISGTLNRDKLRRALTPQAFRPDVLRRAFELCEVNESVTDECYLVEKLGHPIAFVVGSPRNIKITLPDDVVIAEALLPLDD